MRLRDVCKPPGWEGLAVEKLGLALLSRTSLSKAFTQLSADGSGCIPSQHIVCLRLTSALGSTGCRVRLMEKPKRVYTKGIFLAQAAASALCPWGEDSS